MTPDDPSAAAGLAHRQRVLVCDDNSLLVDMIEHHLIEEGYDVELATDGGEAMEKIRARRPDAVVLDAMMPVQSGFEVLRQMREDAGITGVPVIMLTGLSQHEDVVNALELGAAEFMIKPFLPEELIARLKRLLEESPA